MTGQQADIQWYIAREGKQHGPLSDAEMRTFVAQGHFKPTDLIWRRRISPIGARHRRYFRSRQPSRLPPLRRAPQRNRGAPPRDLPRVADRPRRAGQRTFEPNRIRVAQGSDDSGGRSGSVAPSARSCCWRCSSAAAGTLGKAACSAISATLTSKEGEQVPTVAAPDGILLRRRPARPPAAAPAVSQAAVDAGAQELDTKFGKLAAWNVVKREFPDWYGEQLRQAAALSAQNQPEAAVNKHLAEALVALRRQHANEALSASTPKLKEVASAFLDNLKVLCREERRRLLRLHLAGRDIAGRARNAAVAGAGRRGAGAGRRDLRSDRRRPQIADRARQGSEGPTTTCWCRS